MIGGWRRLTLTQVNRPSGRVAGDGDEPVVFCASPTLTMFRSSSLEALNFG